MMIIIVIINKWITHIKCHIVHITSATTIDMAIERNFHKQHESSVPYSEDEWVAVEKGGSKNTLLSRNSPHAKPYYKRFYSQIPTHNFAFVPIKCIWAAIFSLLSHRNPTLHLRTYNWSHPRESHCCSGCWSLAFILFLCCSVCVILNSFFTIFPFPECVSSTEEIPLTVPHVALVPIQTSSPERRITQKEIIAGEERPKYLLIKQHQEAGGGAGNFIDPNQTIHFNFNFLLFFFDLICEPKIKTRIGTANLFWFRYYICLCLSIQFKRRWTIKTRGQKKKFHTMKTGSPPGTKKKLNISKFKRNFYSHWNWSNWYNW